MPSSNDQALQTDGLAATKVLTATLLVMVASVGFGLVPLFAKALSDAGMAPAAIAFSRYLLTALLLLPYLAWRRGSLAATGWGILAGISMGLGWITFVEALKILPVATAGLLYMTYPIFTLLIVWIWLRQPPHARAIAGAGLILVAAACIMTPAATGGPPLGAYLIALMAPLSFGFAIAVLTGKLMVLRPLSRIAAVTLGAVLGLAPMVSSLESAAFWPATTEAWWSVFGIALATALLPQLLYVIYAPRIGAGKAAIAGSVELPTMLAIGWVLFGEQIATLEVVACIIVLSAILITPPRPAHSGPAHSGPAR
ncbi:MAG: EamA family transporter [Rhodospirillales bacterium]